MWIGAAALVVACGSSSPTGSSGSSTSGTSPTSGSNAGSGGGTGSSGGGATGSTSGSASGGTSGSGTGASSGSSLPTLAAAKALCTGAGSKYAAGTMELSPSDFCVLFEGLCSGQIAPGAGYSADEATCESFYSLVPDQSNAGQCRTQHLCYVAAGMGVDPHCFHAQGYMNATTPGGPCM